MKLMAIMVGLLYLAPAAFPQSTQPSKPQIEQPVQEVAVAQLQRNAVELPAEFRTLTGSLDFSKWSCEVEAKEDNQKLIKIYGAQLDKVTYMADTIKATGRPALPEVSDATYSFGLGVTITMVLTKVAECTGQTTLSAQFNALSIELSDAAANSHNVEQQLIQIEEGWLEQMFNTLKQLQQQQKDGPVAPQHPPDGKA